MTTKQEYDLFITGMINLEIGCTVVMRGWQSQQCVELLLNYNYGNVENFPRSVRNDGKNKDKTVKSFYDPEEASCKWTRIMR